MSYTIWCIIIGDTTPFSVKIDQTESVDDLKMRIKKKIDPRLNAFPFNQLTLYKIKEFELEKFNKHAVQDISQNLSEQTSLKPWTKVSEITGGFPENMLHILIEAPAGESIQ